MMLNARSPTRWRKQEEGERAVQSWNKLFWGMGTLMSNTDKGPSCRGSGGRDAEGSGRVTLTSRPTLRSGTPGTPPRWAPPDRPGLAARSMFIRPNTPIAPVASH